MDGDGHAAADAFVKFACFNFALRRKVSDSHKRDRQQPYSYARSGRRADNNATALPLWAAQRQAQQQTVTAPPDRPSTPGSDSSVAQLKQAALLRTASTSDNSIPEKAFRGDSARAELETLPSVVKAVPATASRLSPFSTLRTKQPNNLSEATRSDSAATAQQCDCSGGDAGGTTGNAAAMGSSRHHSCPDGDAMHFQRPHSPRSAAVEAFARCRSIAGSVASDDTIVWPGRGSFDSRGSFSVSFASGSASSASLDLWLRGGSSPSVSSGSRNPSDSNGSGSGGSSLNTDAFQRASGLNPEQLRRASSGSSGSRHYALFRSGSANLQRSSNPEFRRKGAATGGGDSGSDLRHAASGGSDLRRAASGGWRSRRRLDGGGGGGSGGETSRLQQQLAQRLQSGDAPAPLHLFQTEAPHHLAGGHGSSQGPLPDNHRYQCLLELSRGLTTSVQLCLDLETDTPVVLRFVERGGPGVSQERVRRQLAFQQLARDHPHIVQLLDVFVLPEHLAFVTKWANCSNLPTYISTYAHRNHFGVAEKDARYLMRQLLEAVNFAHENGCTKVGIKMEDILLHVDPDNPDVITLKLLCGWSSIEDELFSPSGAQKAAGIPEYQAPEALRSPDHDVQLADSWRIGVVFYALLSGAFPFLTAREAALPAMQRLHAMLQRIISGRPLPLIRSVTPFCDSLLTRLLEADPALRITVAEALQHPWLTTPTQQQPVQQQAPEAPNTARVMLGDNCPSR